MFVFGKMITPEKQRAAYELYLSLPAHFFDKIVGNLCYNFMHCFIFEFILQVLHPDEKNFALSNVPPDPSFPPNTRSF